jgi:hypothetical protein
MNWNLVPVAMMEIDARFFGAAFKHRFRDRASNSAQAAALLIAVHQDIFLAQAPDHLMTQVTGNALSPVIPEDDSPVGIDKIDTGLHLIEDRSEDLGVEQR